MYPNISRVPMSYVDALVELFRRNQYGGDVSRILQAH